MIGVLLRKDLRRALRNPLPWLVNLIVPLAIVAVIGLVFGGGESGLGQIRFAVVDEDDSLLTQLLRGALNRGEASQYAAPEFLAREAALTRLRADKISAVVIVPKGFTHEYLGGRSARLELVKNPAQSVHPAVIEEVLGVLVTGLNAVSRNFGEELGAWQEVIAGKADFHRIAALVERGGKRFDGVRDFLDPPLVSYEKEVQAAGATSAATQVNLFGYLLAGMGAMFLLFLANNGMSDLTREVQLRTLERYHTFRDALLPFVLGKVLFVFVMLLICALLLFGGGGLVFRVGWTHPAPLALLAAAYALFAAGLLALLTAGIPNERVSGGINSLVSMTLGIAGGCAFPPQQLPALVRERVMPLLPTSWFAEAVRGLERGAAGGEWMLAGVKLVALAVVLLAIATWLLRRRFALGARA